MNRTKKYLLMGCAMLALALGTSGCMEDATAPNLEPPAPSDGAALSAEQRTALEADPQLAKLREQLQRAGETVSLDDARLFEHGDKQGIVAPVKGPEGQPREDAQLVVRQEPGRPARFALELAPTTSAATGELRDAAYAAAGVTCGPWTPWQRVIHFCDWAVLCWFGDATYDLVERFRQCCAAGVCRTEGEVSEQRVKCGC